MKNEKTTLVQWSSIVSTKHLLSSFCTISWCYVVETGVSPNTNLEKKVKATFLELFPRCKVLITFKFQLNSGIDANTFSIQIRCQWKVYKVRDSTHFTDLNLNIIIES